MPVTLFFYHTPSKTPNFPFTHSNITISSSLNPIPQQNPTPISSSIRRNCVALASNAEEAEISVPFEASNSNGAIKMPTAPWMKGHLLLQPHEVLDLSITKNKKSSNNGRTEKKSDGDLTDKITGIRGKQAMRTIVKRIEKLRKTDNSEDARIGPGRIEFGDCLEGLTAHVNGEIREKMPWEREEGFVIRRIKKEKTATAAELSLDKALLDRLRGEAAKMRQWVKVKKAGVTQAVVDEIKFTWKRNELAMIKFDVPLCRNMDRAHEIVELKTGGLVVWRNKDILVIYRGRNYQSSSKNFSKKHPSFAWQETSSLEYNQMKLDSKNNTSPVKTNERRTYQRISQRDGERGAISPDFFIKDDNYTPTSGSLYERETDRLLDGLGPRFIDWWMHKPLPVDADLLPEVVPGFKPPVRRCPPNAKSKLVDAELTYLRNLAQPLPTHFVLGRNRRLQGLAVAILKLWEKSLIVKIAIKWGVPNTDNEQMADELKCLTGGVLLLRNKFLVILYRGKDFLPVGVANLIAQREKELTVFQLHEESTRQKAGQTICLDDGVIKETSTVGSLSDFQYIQTEFADLEKKNTEAKVQLEAEKQKIESELRMHEHKLSILNFKIEKSAKYLSKLNASWTPSEQNTDQEIITNEERECFRKIGLKMDSHLILGRRGIFDGVIEGLYQHWKHREVVKVITMQREYRKVNYTAKLLEAESGGILVSVEKLKEGHAIILYRGKNYKRPFKPEPKSLLTKREALLRSLEMQRIGSLKYFAYQKQRAISELKLKLVKLLESGGIS